jgi:AAA family ATP:ADP antiporter
MRAPTEAPWRRFLQHVGIDLRPGEVALALNMFTSFFLITTFQITTKTLRQSAFIDALGAARLPVVYLLVALLSYPFLRLYGRFSERFSIRRLIQISSVVVALGLVVFWLLFSRSWSWVPIAFYVLTSITYALLISQFWMLANHGLDARQARRLFGFIGAGGLLGGIAGGQTARLTTEIATTAGPLAAAAVALFCVALLLERPEIAHIRGAAHPGGAIGKLDKAQGGFEILKRSSQLRWIAVLMVLSVIVAQIVDLQFNWAVESRTTGLAERTAFFGNFFSVMGISAFVFQLVFTSRIHRELGIAFAMRILPVTLAIGTTFLLVAAGMLPSLVIAAALILKIGENGVRYSIDQATRELLFLPVRTDLRLRAKAFIDVFLQRGAKGIAALLLLPVTFGWMAAPQTGWFSLVLVALWLVVAERTYRSYVRTFQQGLQHRSVDTDFSVDLDDPVTLELLEQSLASGDRRQVLHGLEILSSHRKAEHIPAFLLYHDDPAIRRKTLSVLAVTGRLDAVPLIEQRLGDEDPDVRAEAIRVLADLHGQDVCELMVPRLEEADARVRAAAVACIRNHGDEQTAQLADRVLADLIRDRDAAARRQAARAIGAIAEPHYREELVSLFYDRSPEVVNAAAAAARQRVARDGPSPHYLPILISLLNDRRVKHEARAALIAYGEEMVPALRHFLTDPNEPLWVRRALPRVLELVDSPLAMRALVESLQPTYDLFTRRKLIETLRDGRERLVVDDQVTELIEVAIHDEAKSYLRALARLHSLNALSEADCSGAHVRWSESAAPDLLERLLAERASDHVDNLFSLLSILHDPRDIDASLRGLTSGDRAQRAHALEYLDNLLTGECRRAVFAAIDDQPVRDKLRNAWRLFQLPLASRRSTLRELLASDDEREEGGGLMMAALYAVHTDRATGLYARVRRLARAAADPLVRETAAWVLQRTPM